LAGEGRQGSMIPNPGRVRKIRSRGLRVEFVFAPKKSPNTNGKVLGLGSEAKGGYVGRSE
jgi:hypothetical protein